MATVKNMSFWRCDKKVHHAMAGIIFNAGICVFNGDLAILFGGFLSILGAAVATRDWHCDCRNIPRIRVTKYFYSAKYLRRWWHIVAELDSAARCRVQTRDQCSHCNPADLHCSLLTTPRVDAAW